MLLASVFFFLFMHYMQNVFMILLIHVYIMNKYDICSTLVVLFSLCSIIYMINRATRINPFLFIKHVFTRELCCFLVDLNLLLYKVT